MGMISVRVLGSTCDMSLFPLECLPLIPDRPLLKRRMFSPSSAL